MPPEKRDVHDAGTRTAIIAEAYSSQARTPDVGVITTGDYLSPERIMPFLTIALAAAGEDRFMDFTDYSTISREQMSGYILNVGYRDRNATWKTTLVLVGPKHVMQSLSFDRIRGFQKTKFPGLTVQLPLPGGLQQDIQIWNGGNLRNIYTTLKPDDEAKALSLTKNVALAFDGTVSEEIPLQLQTQLPSFSIIFVKSGPEKLRGQMGGLDVYLAPEIETFKVTPLA